MQFYNGNDENGNKTVKAFNYGSMMKVGDECFIRPSDDLIQQMLEYAGTERLGIQQTMEQLGYEDIPGYEKQVCIFLQTQRRLLTIILRKAMLNQMEQDSYR